MLGKLIKYEWKSVSIVLAILHGILLLYTLLGRFGYPLVSNMNTVVDGTITVIYCLIFFLAILVTAIGTFFYLVTRYYRNHFTDQGYLMHTLPVNSHTLIWSKALVFFIWTAIDAIVCTISLYTFISITNDYSIGDFFVEIGKFLTDFTHTFGLNSVLLGTLILVFFLILSSFMNIFMVYFAISLGNMFRKHKVLLSVVFAWLFYTGVQIIMVVYFVMVAFFSLEHLKYTSEQNSAFGFALCGFMIIQLLLGALFYCLMNYIYTKKLNLE